LVKLCVILLIFYIQLHINNSFMHINTRSLVGINSHILKSIRELQLPKAFHILLFKKKYLLSLDLLLHSNLGKTSNRFPYFPFLKKIFVVSRPTASFKFGQNF
jgi:hypothetical protein